MSLQPVLAAPLPVIIHFFTVVPAFFLGAWLLLASVKGSRPHRAIGVAYLLCMSVTAFCTLFIRAPAAWPHIDIGPDIRVSFIHLFIPLTATGVYRGITLIRRGDVDGHRRAMQRLFVGALLIAGSLTILPGRIMHAVFFGN